MPPCRSILQQRRKPFPNILVAKYHPYSWQRTIASLWKNFDLSDPHGDGWVNVIIFKIVSTALPSSTWRIGQRSKRMIISINSLSNYTPWPLASTLWVLFTLMSHGGPSLWDPMRKIDSRLFKLQAQRHESPLSCGNRGVCHLLWNCRYVSFTFVKFWFASKCKAGLVVACTTMTELNDELFPKSSTIMYNHSSDDSVDNGGLGEIEQILSMFILDSWRLQLGDPSWSSYFNLLPQCWILQHLLISTIRRLLWLLPRCNMVFKVLFIIVLYIPYGEGSTFRTQKASSRSFYIRQWQRANVDYILMWLFHFQRSGGLLVDMCDEFF